MTDSDTPSADTPSEDTPAEASPDETSVPDTEAATTAEAPTAEVTAPPAAATDAAGPEPAPTEAAPVPVVGPPPAPTPRSSHVMVPRWAVFLVAGLLLVGAGFGAGWFLNDDDDATSSAVRTPELPTQPDSRPFDEPDGPTVGSTTFLGVSTAPTDDDSGVRIDAVLNGSPADDAGLEADDVIIEVDGEAVDTPRELVSAIQSLDPGDEVTITYERDGDEDSVEVTLTERDDSSTNARPS